MELLIDRIPSPVGEICVIARGDAIVTLDFSDCEERMQASLARRFGACSLTPARDPGGIRGRLAAYFGGAIDALDRVEVATGGTPFQETVWRALRHIRPGETSSYGDLAARLGRPGAARAVGLANGANPVALAIPCHRVIGADGTLTGYAGGLGRKRWLLEHEGALAKDPSLPGLE